jgi:hypothetical protein
LLVFDQSDSGVIKTFDYRNSPVGRFVVGDYNLEIDKFLAENAFQRRRNEFLAVVAGNANADEGL